MAVGLRLGWGLKRNPLEQFVVGQAVAVGLRLGWGLKQQLDPLVERVDIVAVGLRLGWGGRHVRAARVPKRWLEVAVGLRLGWWLKAGTPPLRKVARAAIWQPGYGSAGG